MQWLQEGEKPSSFFCNLEKRNYVDKTMKKVQLSNGSIITSQKEILEQIRQFYEELFKERKDTPSNEIPPDIFSKIKKIACPDIGSDIQVDELSNALKNMKNNKSPGIDGIPADFLKVFWSKLKYHVKNAINSCHKKGELSTSLRQSIITCVPKGNKDRKLLKNWRPISLLCVVYKLATTVIANRLKPHLEYMISKNQSGFLKGRHIEEGTRLVYDIMSYTEKLKIPGLLMLIDFQKAFDSVSWSFLYKVLQMFGLNDQSISWIKLFNHNILSYIIQCGVLSKPIKIERGCRQGDPLAPYLFIMVAEILTLLIEYNPDITGINVGQKQIKLSQFADDTTILLGGTTKSLQATLNTLEIYGSLSGLKVNVEKTKLVWIGSRKNSLQKLDVNQDMCWGENKFSLLGLQFTVNLIQIPRINFDIAIEKAKNELKSWKYRILSPIGKITVLKTLILPKFVHLFSSIHTPHSILVEINKIFYNYLWAGKPDKIKRETTCKNYCVGGLKMVNIFNFEKALKLKWLTYVIFHSEQVWSELLKIEIKNLKYITVLGGEWCAKFYSKLNPFWKDVFTYWTEFCASQKIMSNDDICKSPIWYNSNVNTKQIHFPNWSKQGILFIDDVIDNNGKVLSVQNLKEKYNFNINFLNYHTVQSFVTKFLTKHKKSDNFTVMTPFVPFHLNILIKDTAK